MQDVQKILDEMRKAMGANLKPIEEKKYKCFRCQDTGTIFITEDGITKAMDCPDCKASRLSAKWLKKSGISTTDYEKYKLDTFIADTSMAKQMKKEAIDFLQKKDSLGIGFFGKSGGGKTHICIAICQALNKEHYYWQYRERIQEIKNAMYSDAKTYDLLIRQAKEAPCLYIDDLFKGAEANGKLSQQDLQIMFDIINARYIKRHITIISSEFKFRKILDLDEAIGSRLYEMMMPHVVDVFGENRRLRKKLNSCIIEIK